MIAGEQERAEFSGRGRECEETVRGGRRVRWCEEADVGRGQEWERQKADKKRSAGRKDGRMKHEFCLERTKGRNTVRRRETGSATCMATSTEPFSLSALVSTCLSRARLERPRKRAYSAMLRFIPKGLGEQGNTARGCSALRALSPVRW